MKRLILYIVILFASQTIIKAQTNSLTQISTLNALASGIYEGETTLSELLAKGDFGIGTFNGLNGEMVILNGTIYQAAANGTINKPVPDQKTPFAMITPFKETDSFIAKGQFNFQKLTTIADSIIPTKNIIYAIKADAYFDSIIVRSVPHQSRPFPPLVEVTKTQLVFRLYKTKGTLVGFRFPPYVKGINMPGYHLHFISEDRKAGGHVLSFTMHDAAVSLDEIKNYVLSLPSDSDFNKADLNDSKENEIRKSEK